MKIFHSAAEYDLGPSVAVLGTFDGVHIGHQALIARALELSRELDAACVVCTFDRHPLSLLCPERAPLPLMTNEEKLCKLEKMGVDGVLMTPFTREFASIEPADYLEGLARELRVRAIVTGFNYTFGAGGRGDVRLICDAAGCLDYRAEIVPAVQEGGEIVSSTLIRRLLAGGEGERAGRLMQLQVR